MVDRTQNKSRAKPRVLVVDDDHIHAMILGDVLSKAGYTLARASDGAEALEKARHEPPDLIISDILMPVMDGFTLCRKLKRDRQLRRIPFIFCTATYTDPKDEEFALSMGADRFLVKPVEPDALVESVREVIETYQQAGAPAAPHLPKVDEPVYHKMYNQALIRKLEDKLLQLEETKRELEKEIAERELAQEALQNAHDELEHRVRERTADLKATNEALQQEITERKRAEEMLHAYTLELKAQNKELDAYAHTVAHNLKNLVSNMAGTADALQACYADLPDEELRGYLRTIAQSGYKISNVIDGLLMLAGVRKIEPQMEPLDMAEIVAASRQRLASEIEEYQAEIFLPAKWPVAVGYGPWIEEIWVNLISNALKYGGQPPHVQLGADSPSAHALPASGGGEAQGGLVRFWVRDNGPGLTLDDRARLFTPFTRLHQVQARGHGLGLSIVRRIADKLGGQVGVESEVGAGSTFWFSLPTQAKAPPQ